ncbi:MAG: hypothetical protein SOX26_09010 [Phocaeicola sp.]|nr:hypothetical protein [Phocaeicola sp.]
MDYRIKEYCRQILKGHECTLATGKNNKKWFWNYPAAVSICYNNGFFKRGYSHFSKDTVWAEPLRLKIMKIGKLGYGTPFCKNPLGNCAEQHSGNNLMKSYKGINKLEQLYFTETIRPRTMEVLTPCKHCKLIFPNLK